MSGPVSTADVIGFIESGNNLSALRFEPLVYRKTSQVNAVAGNIMRANLCDRNTAYVIAATSFGRFQIMGFNLYSHWMGVDYGIVEYLNGAARQLATFYSFLDARSINYSISDLVNSEVKRNHFAAVYNGSVENYEPLIVSALNHYGVSVK